MTPPVWAYVLVGLALVIGPVITAWALLRKVPAETRKLSVETVDVNVRMAGELRDDAYEDRRRMKEDLDALRAEFRGYQSEMTQRIEAQDSKIRLQDMRMKRLSEWAHSAFGVMTATQRAKVGPPPLDDPLDDPPPVDGFSSMHPLPPT